MYGCTSLWEKGECKRRRKVATINNVSSLKKLTKLHLTNNEGVIREGTLGNMIEINTLILELTESNYCDFQRMTSLILYKCGMWEELPHSHKMNNLKRLEIIDCSRLKKVPREFGDNEAFSSLEICSIVGSHELEEFPLFKTFIIVECSSLRIFPLSYFNLKTLKIIKIYHFSSMIMKILREI